MVGADREAELRRELAGWSSTSDWPGLIHLLGHLGFIGLSGLLLYAAQGSFWQIPATVLLGCGLIFLFAPLHETVHDTPFKTQALNDAVSWLSALVVILPPTYFRYFHFAHHRNTQDPERDPELATPRPTNLGALALHLTGWNYWAGNGGVLLRHAFGKAQESYLPKGKRRRAILEARLMLVFYLLVLVLPLAFGSTAVIEFWLLPLLAGQPFLRLYLLAEHHGRPFTKEMLANSRTIRTNALVRFLAWNMPFHAEHHLAPNVPFHRLPEAHKLTAPHLAAVTPGYGAALRDIIGMIRRKRLPT